MIKFIVIVLILIPLSVWVGKKCWSLWMEGEAEQQEAKIQGALHKSKKLARQAKTVRKANPSRMKQFKQEIRQIDDL